MISKTNRTCIPCNREFSTRRTYLMHWGAIHGTKNLPCKFCGKLYSLRSQLKLHEHLHRPRAECEVCKKKFGNVHDHKRRKHTEIFCHQCNRCEKVYKTKDELTNHKDDIHTVITFPCKICTKVFTHAVYLKVHEKTHERSGKNYSCIECNETFEEIKSLRQHMQIDHGVKASSSRCEICGKELSSNSSLKEHMLRHAGKKPFACKQCPRAFVTIKYLRVHMRTHTGEKPFKCPDCGRSFAQRYCLSVHRRLHTGERPYSCKDCDKTFISKSAFKVHRKVHNPEIEIKYSHYCDECGKGFNCSTKMLHHKEADHLGIRHTCLTCGKDFRSAYYLSLHVKKHDDNYKPREFSCTQCDKVFETNRSLKRHILKVHENAPPSFMCDICGKGISTAASLRDHKLLHSGVKPHSCPYCDKTFNKQNNLKVHIRTHTQEKPYSCEECGKSFTQIGTLKLHRRLHSGERPFNCDICNKRFVSKSALKLHLTCHGIPLGSIKSKI